MFFFNYQIFFIVVIFVFQKSIIISAIGSAASHSLHDTTSSHFSTTSIVTDGWTDTQRLHILCNSRHKFAKSDKF